MGNATHGMGGVHGRHHHSDNNRRHTAGSQDGPGRQTSFSPSSKNHNSEGEQLKQFPDLLIFKDAACQTSTKRGLLARLSGAPDESDDPRVKFAPKVKRRNLCSVSGLLFAVITTYALFVAAAAKSPYVQSILVYCHKFPTVPAELTNLRAVGLSDAYARNINVTTEDGEMLGGYHLLPVGPISHRAYSLVGEEREAYFDASLSEASRVILYFHGISSNRARSYRINTITTLAAQFDAHVLTIDYRGFGDSTGSPTERGTALDSRALLNYVLAASESSSSGPSFTSVASSLGLAGECKKKESPHIYIYGHSLGAAVAVELAASLGKRAGGALSGIVLDSPFTSLPEAALVHPFGLPFRLFPFVKSLISDSLTYKYRSVDAIKAVDTNVLILHAQRDHMVPIDMGRALHRAMTAGQFALGSKNDALMREVDASGHSTVPRTREFLEALAAFVTNIEARTAVC